MQYQVPQFIEFEDKIFGPFTLKQFIYIAGGSAVSFLLWKIVPFFLLKVIIVIPIFSFCMALAFYKPDGFRPFIFMVEQAVRFYTGAKLYIWKRKDKKIEQKQEEKKEDDISQLYIPKLSSSKLKDLTWSLDIHDTVENQKTNSKFKF
jgi:hypothetical protein